MQGSPLPDGSLHFTTSSAKSSRTSSRASTPRESLVRASTSPPQLEQTEEETKEADENGANTNTGGQATAAAAPAPAPNAATPATTSVPAAATLTNEQKTLWKSLMRIDDDDNDFYESLPQPMLGSLKMPLPTEVLKGRLKDLIRPDFEANIEEFTKHGEPWAKIRTWFLRDIIDVYASFRIFAIAIWTFEFCMVMFFAVGSTCFFSFYSDEGKYLAAKLDFNIIGSAFVFPVTFLISQTFTRRQGALNTVAQYKSLICNLGMGLLNWNWPDLSARKKLPSSWEADVHETLVVLAAETLLLLKLPTWNRNRHLMTVKGRKFRQELLMQQRVILQSVTQSLMHLTWFVEDLKQIGLPANEASRLNQYVSLMQICFEKLVQVKNYRTPTVSRGFVRIFILIVPVFYGPYFSWVAGNNGAQVNVGFAIALTIVYVLIFCGLVTVQRSFEDPFLASKGDDIDLEHEYRDLCDRLARIHVLSKEEQFLRTGREYAAEQEQAPNTIPDTE